jgi:hypothetical protein
MTLYQGETYFLKDAIEKKTTNGFFCRFELYNNLGHFIDDSIVGVGFTAEEAVFDARKKAENLKIEIKLLN